MTALSRAGNATVTEGIINLPQIVEFPTPDLPNPLPPTTNLNNPGALTPGSYGNISLTSNTPLHLIAGTYNVNSISMSGGAMDSTGTNR
jgi:hypothetical protein